MAHELKFNKACVEKRVWTDRNVCPPTKVSVEKGVCTDRNVCAPVTVPLAVKFRNSLIKRIWGIAKSKGMNDENLHDFIFGYTKKTSIRDLSDKQLSFIINMLDGKKAIKTVFKKFTQDEYLQNLIGRFKSEFQVADMPKYLDEMCWRMFKTKFLEITSRDKQKLISALKESLERKV